MSEILTPAIRQAVVLEIARLTREKYVYPGRADFLPGWQAGDQGC